MSARCGCLQPPILALSPGRKLQSRGEKEASVDAPPGPELGGGASAVAPPNALPAGLCVPAAARPFHSCSAVSAAEG